ncbi:HAD family hydrolase [Kitasatospora sp. NPDC057015]|uniref:HAD family hydrolase n=1 Tax=Kitasatospora sp. NPDC057015 TaxID=3346001 RepID=UPI0036396DCC
MTNPATTARVVWDWNGTVRDDLDDHVAALNATLPALGGTPVTVDTYRALHRVPIRSFYDQLLGREISNKEWRDNDAAFLSVLHQRPVRLRSGVRQLMMGLRARGVGQSLLSLAPHEQLMHEVRHVGITGLMERVDGRIGPSVTSKAPALAAHLHALGPGIDPATVIVIGDSVDDATAARGRRRPGPAHRRPAQPRAPGDRRSTARRQPGGGRRGRTRRRRRTRGSAPVTQPPAPAVARPTADPTKVGTALVLRTLGVERLSVLAGWHDDEDTPLGRLTDEVHRTARRLDHVQQSLVTLATSIRRDMQRVIAGDDVDLPQTHGLLGSSAQSLDLLVARRAELYQHLDGLTQLHKILAAAPASASVGPTAEQTASEHRGTEPPPRTTKLSSAQQRVLDAVARGRVTVHEGSIHNGLKIYALGVQVSTASVNSLIERKLIDRDTSTSLYVGQKLRLTAAGARVHASLPGIPPAGKASSPRTPPAVSEPPAAVSIHPPRTTAGQR